MAIVLKDLFDFSDWTEFQSFVLRNYGSDHVLLSREFVSWQFGRFGKKKTILTAWDNDSIIGILGYIPVSFRIGGEIADAAWMANWMVDKDVRHGPGIILMRRLQERFRVLLGQGANSANVSIAKKMGFTVYDSIPRWGAIFDAGIAKKYWISESAFAEKTWSPPSEAQRGETVRAADFDFDSLLTANYVTGGCAVRDAGYLEWRYSDHPFFEYFVHRGFAGAASAICISRVENTSDDNKVGRILDLLFDAGPEGGASAKVALNEALLWLRDSGCGFADFYCSYLAKFGILQDVGMFDLTAQPLVSRFCPVDTAHFVQNLEVWIDPAHKHDMSLDGIYVSKADGDQDRPNSRRVIDGCV